MPYPAVREPGGRDRVCAVARHVRRRRAGSIRCTDLPRESEYAEEARRFYCSTVGVEFSHITDVEKRRWIQERMEAAAPSVDQNRALDLLIRADLFELVLQQRYLGTKRFSLEGVTALIPLVDEILDGAGQHGEVGAT